MIKCVAILACLSLFVMGYVVYRDNQTQQRKELNKILNDARNSLDAIEKNQKYPTNFGSQKYGELSEKPNNSLE